MDIKRKQDKKCFAFLVRNFESVKVHAWFLKVGLAAENYRLTLCARKLFLLLSLARKTVLKIDSIKSIHTLTDWDVSALCN